MGGGINGSAHYTHAFTKSYTTTPGILPTSLPCYSHFSIFFRSDLLFLFNVHFALVFPTFFSGEVFGIFPWSGTPESLLAFPDRITDVKTVRFNDQVSDHDGVVVNVDLKCAFGEHDLMVSMKVVYDVADTMAAGIESQRVDE